MKSPRYALSRGGRILSSRQIFRIRPDLDDLSPEEARAVLRWKFSDADRSRADKLSAKETARRRARFRCEYCHLPERIAELVLQFDHATISC